MVIISKALIPKASHTLVAMLVLAVFIYNYGLPVTRINDQYQQLSQTKMTDNHHMHNNEDLHVTQHPKKGLFIPKQSVPQRDKNNKCDQDVDEHKLYTLPADTELDGLDDNNLYHSFSNYISTCQYRCHNLTRLGPSADDKGKNVCSDQLYKPKHSSCLVYSFGSNFNFQFEEAVWKTYKCEIHTFDPSRSLDGVKIPSGVNFHLTGLSGKDFVRSSPEVWRKVSEDSPKDWDMKTLSTIRKSLNHTNRIIDILKIDIEGWEWGTMTEIMRSGVLKYVKQICLEVHFGYGFKPVYKNNKPITVEFTSEKWGNTPIPDQLKVLKSLFQNGLRIFMYDPIKGWATRHVKNPDRNIDTLVEISLANINLINKVSRR